MRDEHGRQDGREAKPEVELLYLDFGLRDVTLTACRFH
jgi:hypothetical protein